MMHHIRAGKSLCLLYDDSRNTEQQLTFELERDSTLDLTLVLRGIVGRLSVSVRLMGENAQAHIKGVYILNNDASLTFETQQLHQAPHTISTCTIKGILYDTSSVQYRGTIYVNAQAHHTNAKQLNKNILLSPSARATSIPSLEVLTKQVQCSHGSAVGTIDKDLLFYMQARGLPQMQAQRLLLQGFVGEIIDGMPLTLVEHVKELIH